MANSIVGLGQPRQFSEAIRPALPRFQAVPAKFIANPDGIPLTHVDVNSGSAPQAYASPLLFGKAYGKKGEFTPGISLARLKDIFATKTRKLVIDVPGSALAGLSDGDRKALVHLVKAADILEQVWYKQDHPDNIRARDVLANASAKGDEQANLLLQLFDEFRGIEGKDMYAKKTKPLRLFRDKKLGKGKGFYPQDLTDKELVGYLKARPQAASAILGNNTMVQRDGNRLIAVPYSVAFRDEMEAAADEIMKAAQSTSHDGFKKYLQWQAQALTNDSDAEMTFNSDKTWATLLEDAPLEFTIARESYEDELSAATADHKDIKPLLAANGIQAKAKDSLGVRVGIVNPESSHLIQQYRKHLAEFAKTMPLADAYKQAADGKGITFADVDLVALSGDYAAVRGGITVAQNLPNSDKLAVQLDAGSRIVFHRQVRQQGDAGAKQKFLDALIEPSQHGWYDAEADFQFTVGHELAHSLGPTKARNGQDKKSSLGKFGDLLEENKADVASIYMTDFLVKKGELTQEQANKIYLSWVAGELPISEPTIDQAHRVRSIMQLNYFIEHGAAKFKKGGKLSIVPEKMNAVAKQMLTDVVELQLAGDAQKAEAFVTKWFKWNPALQYAADERKKLKPKLYRVVEQPLRQKLLEKASQG